MGIKKTSLLKTLQIRNKYTSLYNDITEKNSPLVAFSNLSQARIELERKRDKLVDEVEEFTDQIKYLTKEEKEDNVEMEKAKFAVSYSMISTFPYNLYLPQFNTSKENLTHQLNRLFDLKNIAFNSSILDRVNKAYKDKEELEIIVIHLSSIDAITDRILDNSYPEKLPEYTESEIETELNEERQTGRKLDKSAPQKPIVEKVRELTQRKRFLDENGNPKPTTITDELLNNHSHLVGELSDRSVFRRVKKALDSMT